MPPQRLPSSVQTARRLLGAVGFVLVLLSAVSCDTGDSESLPVMAVELTWSAIDRYGADLNGNGLADLANTPGYVQARPNLNGCPAGGCSEGPPVFEIELIAHAPDVWPTDTSFGWVINGSHDATARQTTTVPQLRTSLAEGRYEVVLEVVDGSGNALGRTESAFEVEDIFIAALGGTLLTGDGAPEISVVSPNLVQIGIGDDEAAGAGGTRLDVVWGDSGDAGTSATADFRFESVVPSGPAYYAQSFGGDPVSQDHARARRSSRAIPSLAALALEREDPHTSVTLVNLAASGATLDIGVLGPYAGAPGEPLSSTLPPMPAQLDGLAALAGCESVDGASFAIAECARPVDALVLSVGYSDLGFPTALAALIARDSTFFEQITTVTMADVERGVTTGDWSHLVVALDAVSSVIGGPDLPRSSAPLDQIDRSLDEFLRRVSDTVGDPAILLLLAPDPFVGQRGPCSSALEKVTQLGELDSDEIEWLRTNMIGALNSMLKEAATRHGWTVVASPGEVADDHGVCDPDATTIANDPGQIFPPTLNSPTGDGVRWFLDAREAALIVGGSRTTLPPALFPNSHGREHLAGLVAGALRERLGVAALDE